MDPSDAGYYIEPSYFTSPKVKKENFVLGQDPNWLGNFAQKQQGSQQAAALSNQEAQYMGMGARGLQSNATAANSRGGPTANYSQSGQTLFNAQQRAQQGVDQTGQQQGALAAQLQDFAAKAGTGPSAAQAQLAQGRNDALAASLAMAKSGGSGGFGESAASLDAASRNAGSQIASAGNASAQLAAQEEQARRAQQLQAYAQSGQALQGVQQGQLGQAAALSDLARQQAAQQEFNVNAQLQGRAQNDQAALGWTNASLQGQQAALAAENAAQNTNLGAQQLELGANNAQLGASMNQEQLNAQLYGTDADIYKANLQNQVENRNLDQQFGRDVMGGIGSAVSAIGGLVALSDSRSKRSVRRASSRLDEVYRALTET